MSDNAATVLIFAVIIGFIGFVLWLLVSIITSPFGITALILGGAAVLIFIALGVLSAGRSRRAGR